MAMCVSEKHEKFDHTTTFLSSEFQVVILTSPYGKVDSLLEKGFQKSENPLYHPEALIS